MLAAALIVIILATLLGIPALARGDDADNKAAERRVRLEEELQEQLKETNRLKSGFYLEEVERNKTLAEANRKRREAGQQETTDLSARGKQIEENAIVAESIVGSARENAEESAKSAKSAERMAAAAERRSALAPEDAGLKKEAKDARDLAGQLQDNADMSAEHADEAEEDNKKAIDRGKSRKRTHEQTGTALTKLTGLSSNYNESMLGGMMANIKAAGGFTNWLGDIGEAFVDTLSPANLLSGTIEKVFESTIAMALAADSAFASFNRTTGAGSEMRTVLTDVRTETAHMGVSFSEAVAATEDLYTGMRRFAEMTQAAQTQLAGFSASMTRLGVASQTTAKFMNNSTTSLNMTNQQAQLAQRELAATAAALGRPFEEMVAGFNEVQGQLAKYGDQAIEVYKGLAAAAKATGAEVSQLMGIVSQYDTFEGAAEAAGRLNAVLGGDLLNSVDLLNASEDERIRMLIQSIELSGRSWESMGRFERQAVANAAGIQDMTVANQLFGQSLTAYDQAQRAAEAGAMSQEEMERRAVLNTSAQEKLKLMMESLAIATKPLVDMMNFFMNILLKIQKFTGGMFVPVLFLLIGAYAALVGIGKIAIKQKEREVVQSAVTAGWSKIKTFWTNHLTAAKLRQHAVDLQKYIHTQKHLLINSLEIKGTKIKAFWTNQVTAAKLRQHYINLKAYIFGWLGIKQKGVEIALIQAKAAAHRKLFFSMLKSLGIIGLLVAAFFIFRKLGFLPALLFSVAAAFVAIKMATMGKAKMAMMAIATAIAAIAGAITAKKSPPLYVLLPIVAFGLWALGKAAKSAGPALGRAALPTGAFGVALATVLLPIALIVVAVSLLVASFALLAYAVSSVIGAIGNLIMMIVDINPLKLVALGLALIPLSIGLVIFGFAAALAVIPLLALGLALLMISAPVFIISAAFILMGLATQLVATSFVLFAEVLSAEFVLNIIKLAFALPILALGLLALAFAAAIAVIPLAIVGIALLFMSAPLIAIGITFSLVGTAILAVAQAFKILSEIISFRFLLGMLALAPVLVVLAVGVFAFGIAAMVAAIPIAIIALSLALLGGAIALAVSSFVLLAGVLSGGFIIGLLGLAIVLPILAISLIIFGAAAIFAAVPLLILGVAFMLMGVGMTLLTAGLAIVAPLMKLFAESLGEISPFRMFIVGIALAMLSTAAVLAAPGLLILGVATMFAAVGFALMMYPLMFVTPLMNMFATSIAAIDPTLLFALSAGLITLAMAFLTMGIIFMMPWTSVGLLAVSAGLSAIGDAFKYMSVEKMSAFERLTNQLKNMDKDVGVNLRIMGWGVRGVADAIHEVPIMKSIILAHTMEKMAEVSTSVTSSTVENAKNLTSVIKEAAEIKVGLFSVLRWDNAIDNFIKVMNAATGGSAGGAGGGKGNTTVVLELDGRQLGKVIVDLIDENYSLRTAAS